MGFCDTQDSLGDVLFLAGSQALLPFLELFLQPPSVSPPHQPPPPVVSLLSAMATVGTAWQVFAALPG